MYVLTINDNVILGPVDWRPRMFNSALEDELGITFNIQLADKANLPLVLSDGVKVRECVEIRPDLNTRWQHYDGPFWTFTDTLGTATYTAVTKPGWLIKKQLKEYVADIRWQNQIKGTTATVQSILVTIETTKDEVTEMINQWSIMQSGDTVWWKFPEQWINLTKAELASCIVAAKTFIQYAFNWERTKDAEITACTSAADFIALDLTFA